MYYHCGFAVQVMLMCVVHLLSLWCCCTSDFDVCCPFITTYYGFAVQVILICYIYLEDFHCSKNGPEFIYKILRFKADLRWLLLQNVLFFFLKSVSPGP